MDRKRLNILYKEMEYSGKSIEYPEPNSEDGRPLGAEVIQLELKNHGYKVDVKKLIGNPDAKIWAEEFVKMVKNKPSIATDEGSMIGWFANAIMAGYDKAREIYERKILDDKDETH